MIPKKFTENGQALVVIALAAVVLFGFTALAIDGSAKFSDRRHAQNAADTAALAGALSLVNNETTACGLLKEWECLAFLRAEDNGYDNFTNNQVWVFQCNDPDRLAPDVPLNCGAYEGNENYIEVIIYSDINTTFARVFGWDQFHNLVQAVTYAKPGKNLHEGSMIISYDPNPTCPSGPGNGGGSVDVQGSSTLNLNDGGILINSGIACGYNAPNCPDINITGGAGINSVAVSPMDNITQKDSSSSCLNPPAPEIYNEMPVVIPEDSDNNYPDVPPECDMMTSTPNYPAPTKLGEIMVSGNPQPVEEWLIYPGYYTDFPQATLVANKSHIYMASGVYCIDVAGPTQDKDLSWSAVSAAVLNGSTESNPSKNNYNKYHTYNPDGVTLYIKTGDSFKINASSPTYLDATNDPDSAYQGYLIVLEGTYTDHPTCIITGGADININGLIYAPYCDITIDGGSSPTAEINAQLIGWDIKITGNTTINFNYDPSNLVKIKRKVGLMK